MFKAALKETFPKLVFRALNEGGQRMRGQGLYKSGLGALLALAVVGGCAQNVGDVNRVQPGYTKKALFDPANKWYTMETVTRVDQAASNVLFEGLENGQDKIRWKIEEETLYAYRAYENVVGETFGGDTAKQGAQLYFGSPVAAYKITSHFDIKRDYNPATGEQSNVIQENTSDRPWYEREYMRVDWSKNVAVDDGQGSISFLTSLGNLSGVAPLARINLDTEQEKANPYRLTVEEKQITVPEAYSISPDIEYCMRLGYVFDNEGKGCVGGTADVLRSFVRIDSDKEYDFAPVYYPDTIPVRDDKGDRILVDEYGNACDKQSGDAANCTEFRLDVFQRFGLFRTQRLQYDRQHGVTESARIQLANVWPIFDQYYQRTDKADNEDGSVTFTGDFITDKNNNRVEINLEDKKIKPITYYSSISWPDYQLDVAQKIMSNWNDVFKDALKNAYLVEASRTTDSARKSKLQSLAKGKIPDVFLFARNSCNLDNVSKYLDDHGSYKVQSSGKTITLRDAVDALTKADGGVVYGNLPSTCALLEWYTDAGHPERRLMKDGKPVEHLDDDDEFTYQRNGDIRYPMLNWVQNDQLSGPLGIAQWLGDPETGMIINANANVYGAELEKYAFTAQQWLDAMNDPNASTNIMLGQDTAKAMDTALKQSKKRREQVGLLPTQEKALKSRFAKIASRDNKQTVLKNLGQTGEADAKLQSIKGTAFEKTYLINDDMLDFWSNGRYSREKNQMSQDQVEALYKKASPSNWLSSQSRHGYNDALSSIGTGKNPYHGGDVGGCVFPSSALDDTILPQALKYKNVKDKHKVWESLSKDINLAVMLHEVGHDMGLRHNFRASADALNYFDKYWDIQKAKSDDPAKHELEYSSIMDYGANFNTDLSGLGKYDRAAVAFGYLGLIQVFDLKNRSQVAFPAFPSTMQGLPSVDPVRFLSVGSCEPGKGGCRKDNQGDGWLMDYKKLPDILGGEDNIKKARAWVKFSDYVENWRAALTNGKLAKGTVDLGLTGEEPKFAVPYGFCSDEFASSLWGMACNRFDKGGNVEEQIQNQVDMQNFRYIFSAFKRDRYDWDPGAYLAGLSGRYFSMYGDAFRYLYYANIFLPDIYQETDFYKDLAAGAVIGLGTLGDVINRPDVGVHCLDQNLQTPAYYPVANYNPGCVDDQGNQLQSINIPVGVGHAATLGYSQDYYYAITRVGSIYEKMEALGALADSEGAFIRFDSGEYFRLANIGFYRLFKDDVLKWMTGLVFSDSMNIGGKIDANGEFVSRPVVMDLATPDQLKVFSDPQAPVVYPQIYDIHKFYTLLYGAVFMNSTVDSAMDFSKYSNISVKGSNDDYTWYNTGAYLAQVQDLQLTGTGNTQYLLDTPVTQLMTGNPVRLSGCLSHEGTITAIDATNNVITVSGLPLQQDSNVDCTILAEVDTNKLEVLNPVNGSIYRSVAVNDLGGTTQYDQSMGFMMLYYTKQYQELINPLARLVSGDPLDADQYQPIFDYFGFPANTQGQQAVDALSGLFAAIRDHKDPSTAPGADLLAQLFGMSSSKDPKYNDQARQVAASLKRSYNKYQTTYVDQLEWLDTMRNFNAAFKFGAGGRF